MPSDKAIEDALNAWFGKSRVFSNAEIDRPAMARALTAAYAIDGDFNDGVEASSDEAALYGADEEVVAAILRLKR